MRRLSDGTVSYTFRDRETAERELNHSPVWVAPNSIYEAENISPAVTADERNTILYVGRFEPAKKVPVLIEALANLLPSIPDLRLVLIGDGSQRKELEALIAELRLGAHVDLPGWIDAVEALRPYYESAFCTVSPGFAGLGLTQSLGFGVPMLIARGEHHSPEIELASTGGVVWVSSSSAEEFSKAIETVWESRNTLPSESLSRYIRQNYSAESMAAGLSQALNGPMKGEPIG